MRKIIFLMLFVLGGWEHSVAQTFTSDGLVYNVTSSSTVEVGNQNGAATGIITIPSQVTYNSTVYNVTSIGDYAFLECSALTSVTIPNSITSIGVLAFAITGLTSVAIPNSVTSIGGYAFGLCSNLATVTCNASVPLVIDASVFFEVNQVACILVVPAGAVAAYQAAGVWQDFGLIVSNPTFANTTTISVCDSYTWLVNNQTYTTSGTYYYASTNDSTNYSLETLALTVQSNFTSDGINYVVTSPTTVAVGVNASATGIVVIPTAVTTACGAYAVTSIGEKAFKNCTSLTSVTIPNSVTSIGKDAFNDCSSLTSVTIPNSVTSIGLNAFAYCTGLTSVTIPNSVTSIDDNAFQECSGLTSVTIPNSVTSLGQYAFYRCSGLTSVTLPNAITSISSGVFNSCGQLPSISIPNSVTSIGQYAFNRCSSLTSVAIGNSVTSIGDYAFAYCTGLTSVTIPNSVTSIGNSAFFICTGLNSVTIPDSVTSIGNGAFQSCYNLTSVAIPNSLTSIGATTFAYCSGLTSVNIPNSVTSIGDSAFQNCNRLTSITIGNSVTNIGIRAFANCASLTSVICNVSTPMTITANVFEDVNQGACSLAVPAASVAAYQAAAVWQNFNPITSATTAVYNTTTVSACASYTWANNNVTYTTTGVYTGTTTDGVTEQLDLTINNTTPPTASAQTFCGSKTVADLVATGTDLQWYDVATNGTSLASTTAITTGTYYVTQTLNSCESDRTSVAVTVSASSDNITTIAACESYTWNGIVYNATGVYTGLTANCVTEKLDLTITTQATNFTSDGINYVVTSATTVAVGTNASATGVIVIPDSVTTACGTYAVTGINNSAFQGRAGITSVTIPNSVTSIGMGAFASCSGLTSVIIPNSVTSIGIYAFNGCSGLTSVTLPNAITSISTGVFAVCSKLASISIPNSVTSIGDNVFQNCSSLTSITIPNTVTSLGKQVFQNCSGLTSVSISNSVPSIGNEFFQFCTSLTSVTIPNSVTSIGQNAFQGCTGLNSVTLSNSLTSIGTAAFNSCKVLSTITIPNSVTSIGSFAFVSCSGLTTVTIGNSVTSIGASAFSSCTGLTSVICNISTPVTINANVFHNVNQSTCSLTVPNTSVVGYQEANVWRNFAVTTTTKLLDSQCGITLAALSTVIVPVAVAVGQGYKYKVTNTVTNEVNYYTRSKTATFALSQRADTGSSMAIKLSSTYAIAVAVKINGVFSDYGGACLVSTPLLRTTKIQDALCGTTLANINSYLYLKAQVAGQNGYRYKVTQGSEERTYDRIPTRFNPFQLKQLVGGAAYATTYEIAVSVFYNGVWQPYGASCTVTTPAAPQSKLTTSLCGMRLNRTNSTVLSATSVSVAQAYRFEVSKGASTYTVETASNLQRSFKMTEVPGLTLESDATYSIRVAIKANGTWQPYGTSCNVTTYGSPAPVKMAATVAKPETVFNAVAYPNPFASTFQLKIDSASQTAVDLKVYDVMGRLIEQRQVNAAEGSEQEIGNNYPSGVYNIILNQGENVKTLRVIKK